MKPGESFAQRVKRELARNRPASNPERLAELIGLLQGGGLLLLGGGHRPDLGFRTEQSTIAQLFYVLVKELYGRHSEVEVRRGERPRVGRSYLVRLRDPELTRRLGPLAGLPSGGEGGDRIPRWTQALRRRYLAGLFLAAGYLTSPRGGYHAELAPGPEALETAERFLREDGFTPRRGRRGDGSFLYFKDAEQVIRFIGHLGAATAVFELENARAYREVRGQVNRLVNCETANLEKAVLAGVRQVEEIRLVERLYGLDRLKASVRETALARLEHPEASLTELAGILEVGRSAVNHRLRKISLLAQRLGSGESPEGSTGK